MKTLIDGFRFWYKDNKGLFWIGTISGSILFLIDPVFTVLFVAEFAFLYVILRLMWNAILKIQ